MKTRNLKIKDGEDVDVLWRPGNQTIYFPADTLAGLFLFKTGILYSNGA